jgi:hypothetical protein
MLRDQASELERERDRDAPMLLSCGSPRSRRPCRRSRDRARRAQVAAGTAIIAIGVAVALIGSLVVFIDCSAIWGARSSLASLVPLGVRLLAGTKPRR